ncbi:hypothetical protein [Ferrimicrobium acidiphilum]|jgi:hypothetical protein|uniref:hypothetical protein n=1 Tax=Ferrimicrobium acidiphilum TaxID=121039 RepID=UPI0023F44888|nr:hypothetical protein [Ferrimicrobium acidiphilum]
MATIIKSSDLEDAVSGDVFACYRCSISTLDIEQVRIGGWTISGGSQDEQFDPLLMADGDFLICRSCWDDNRD